MLIMHLINSLEKGGAEGTLVRLVSNDQSNQHIIVSLLPKCDYDNLLSNSQITVLFLDFTNVRHVFRELFKLIGICKRFNPDILQSWMYHSNLIGLMVTFFLRRKPKLIWNIRHGVLSVKHDKLSLILLVCLSAFFNRIFGNKTIFCAASSAKTHFKFGFKKSTSVIIGNAYLPYSQEQCQSSVRIVTPKTLSLVYAARFHPQKNHAKLFEVLSRLKGAIPFQLTLLGRGCDNANVTLTRVLEKYELTSHVRLVGLVEDPRYYMKISDYTILVSDYGEGFPNVLGESLSVGTPCITTDVGDANLIVGDCGEIVRAKSRSDLEQKIRQAWLVRQDTQKYVELRKRSLLRYEEYFTISNMVDQYDDFWLSACSP